MFWLTLILFGLLILILGFIFRYSLKRNNRESFSNYTQIPNLEPVIGPRPNIYFPFNYQYSDNFYFSKSEISNKTMDKILTKNIDFKKRNKYQQLNFSQIKEYKYDYYSGFTGYKINNEIVRECILDVVNKINRTTFKDTPQNNTVYFLFILVDFQIIKVSSHQEILNIETLIDLYRFEKASGFQIYLEMYIDKNEIIINKMSVSGNFNEDNIKINPFQNESNVQLYKEYPYYTPNINNQNGYLLDSNEKKKKTLSVNENIKLLENRLNKGKNVKYDNSFKCINSTGDNLYDCISDKNIIGEKKKPGVWDRPCLFDIECPFYKANKNTENNFGGCVNGTCQMPLGVKNVGHHFYTDLDRAVCYNCIDKEYCCQDQLNLKKYSKLKSPDYAFKNDKRLF